MCLSVGLILNQTTALVALISISIYISMSPRGAQKWRIIRLVTTTATATTTTTTRLRVHRAANSCAGIIFPYPNYFRSVYPHRRQWLHFGSNVGARALSGCELQLVKCETVATLGHSRPLPDTNQDGLEALRRPAEWRGPIGRHSASSLVGPRRSSWWTSSRYSPVALREDYHTGEKPTSGSSFNDNHHRQHISATLI